MGVFYILNIDVTRNFVTSVVEWVSRRFSWWRHLCCLGFDSRSSQCRIFSLLSLVIVVPLLLTLISITQVCKLLCDHSIVCDSDKRCIIRSKCNIVFIIAIPLHRCPRASDGHYSNNLVDIGMSCRCDCLINSLSQSPAPLSYKKTVAYLHTRIPISLTHKHAMFLRGQYTGYLYCYHWKLVVISYIYHKCTFLGVRRRTCVTINNSSLFIMKPMTVGKCRL